jgi:hypothetical protein
VEDERLVGVLLAIVFPQGAVGIEAKSHSIYWVWIYLLDLPNNIIMAPIDEKPKKIRNYFLLFGMSDLREFWQFRRPNVWQIVRRRSIKIGRVMLAIFTEQVAAVRQTKFRLADP